MRTINYSIFWLAFLAACAALASCDTFSSVDYNIHNISSDTVTVAFYKEIMTSPYHGYTIEQYDSVSIHFDADSDTIAILAPNQHMNIHREWHGLFREERVVHAWRYISSLRLGQDEASPDFWNNEAAWRFRSKGGGRFEKGESRYYDLWIQ